jgi:hypothetical protein
MHRLAWIFAVAALVVTGCATSRITNLTTTRQPRNPSGVYRVEFVWDDNQQTIIEESIKPYVVVGFESYPMRPALNIKNRWETEIPVSPDKKYITYNFKADYMYRAFGKPQKSSRLSPSYRLDIID